MTPSALEFHHFAARSGEAGKTWVQEYLRPEVQRPVQRIDEALLLMRRRKLDAGLERLQETTLELRRLSELPPAVLSVLDRWYFGVLSFYQYCVEDFEAATGSLSRAEESVVAALSGCRFLLPLANHCHEFRLHHARIARNQRHWDEMWRHIEVARAMMEDRSPLCLLADGSAVGYSDLIKFYRALEPLSPQELDYLKEELNPELRIQLFQRFTHSLCTIPGFVIPYP
ncbi:MAG TPA: hypothetical protein VF789_31455 [Thermoanaerobaculia bacterium]